MGGGECGEPVGGRCAGWGGLVGATVSWHRADAAMPPPLAELLTAGPHRWPPEGPPSCRSCGPLRSRGVTAVGQKRPSTRAGPNRNHQGAILTPETPGGHGPSPAHPAPSLSLSRGLEGRGSSFVKRIPVCGRWRGRGRAEAALCWRLLSSEQDVEDVHGGTSSVVGPEGREGQLCPLCVGRRANTGKQKARASPAERGANSRAVRPRPEQKPRVGHLTG